jgi:hypothetical protein
LGLLYYQGGHYPGSNKTGDPIDISTSLRIFISSPGDVGEERLLTHRVIKRLQGEFADKIQLESIFWEQEPLLASADFQTQLPAASAADIFGGLANALLREQALP